VGPTCLVAYFISSCFFLILSSNDCSSGLVGRILHMCVPASHILMHSFSKILSFATNAYAVRSLWALSSGDFLGVACTSKSMVFVRRPLISSLIFPTFSSIVDSTTISTYGTSLYYFWSVVYTFYAICSTSSLSFKALVTFPSTSLFSILDFFTCAFDSLFFFSASSTHFSTVYFFWSKVVYYCYSSSFSAPSLSNSFSMVSTQNHIS
jgi:hypothetical protein